MGWGLGMAQWAKGPSAKTDGLWEWKLVYSSHCRDCMEVPQKIKSRAPYNAAIPHVDM